MEKSIYDTNETMKMIGKQPINPIAIGGAAYNDFKTLLEARIAEKPLDVFSLAADAFNLGMIYGKREERTKHND